MSTPSTSLANTTVIFSIAKGRRERFDFVTGTTVQGSQAVEVRLMVLNGGRWTPTPHAFRHRRDLAASFATAYAAVASTDREAQ